jgi:hypothetical protein
VVSAAAARKKLVVAMPRCPMENRSAPTDERKNIWNTQYAVVHIKSRGYTYKNNIHSSKASDYHRAPKRSSVHLPPTQNIDLGPIVAIAIAARILV